MNDSSRNQTVDVLKGICVIFIIITHLGWTNSETKNLLFPFWIDMAVPVFMILSGYTNTLSYCSKNVRCFSEAYDGSLLRKKILRFVLPFLPIWAIQVMALFLHKSFSGIGGVIAAVRMLFTGAYGPGSYYFPLMIQFVFIFPVVYFLIKRLRSFGLGLCFILNFVFEVMKWAYDMGAGCYRLIIFRYLFLIAFGTYMVIMTNLRIKTSFLVSMLIIGSSFIIFTQYEGYQPIIFAEWTGTSMIAVLYIIPIVYFIMNRKISFTVLEYLGKASYHIFLMQLAYYWVLRAVGFPFSLNNWVWALINVMICSLCGLTYWKVDNLVTGYLLKNTKKMNSSFLQAVSTWDNLLIKPGE